MLTNPQRKQLDSLDKGELMSSQQRADLYYRVSKNINKTLKHSIKDTVGLLDEIPEPYLAKIDFYEAAINALNLIEKLINRLEPSLVWEIGRETGDDQKPIVTRKYRVEVVNPLSNISNDKSIAFVSVVYEPAPDEIEFLDKLKKLHDHIERVTNLEYKDWRNYTLAEYNEKIKKFENKKNLIIKSQFIGAAKPEGKEPPA